MPGTTTTSTLLPCIAFAPVIDPNNIVTVLTPGVATTIPVSFTARGSYDVFLSDGGAGGGVACVAPGCINSIDTTSVGGYTVNFTYTAPLGAPDHIILVAILTTRGRCGSGDIVYSSIKTFAANTAATTTTSTAPTVTTSTTTTTTTTTSTTTTTTSTTLTTTTTTTTTPTTTTTTTTAATTTTTVRSTLGDVGITAVDAPKANAGSVSKVKVKVKNYSNSSQTRNVSLFLNGQNTGIGMLVTLDAGKEGSVIFNVEFDASGPATLEASLFPGDSNPSNDTEMVTVKVGKGKNKDKGKDKDK